MVQRPSHIFLFLRLPSVPRAPKTLPTFLLVPPRILYLYSLIHTFLRRATSHYGHQTELLPIEQVCFGRQAHGFAQLILCALFPASSKEHGECFLTPKYVRTTRSGGRGQGTSYLHLVRSFSNVILLFAADSFRRSFLKPPQHLRHRLRNPYM